MHLPAELTATTFETCELEDGSTITIPKTAPTFQLWRGISPTDTFGSKPFLNYKGHPLFAEFVILRLLESEGWTGAWIDSYRRKNWAGPGSISKLPILQRSFLNTVYQCSGKDSGCFDIFAWKGDLLLFAEAKRAGKDKIRESQRRWLSAARMQGVPDSSFLIVEWTLRA